MIFLLFKIWITILILSMVVTPFSNAMRQYRALKSVWHKVYRFASKALWGSLGIGAASGLIYVIVEIWRAV